MEMTSTKRLVVYGLVCLLLPPALLALPRSRPQPAPAPAPDTAAPPATPSAGKPLPSSRNPWTLAEAREALKRQPDDSYLQFVVLQLARQQERVPEVIDDIPRFRSRRDGDAVSLFGPYPDTAAQVRSLQLEVMIAGQTAVAKPKRPIPA